MNAFTSLVGVSIQTSLKPTTTKLSPRKFADRRAFASYSSWRSEIIHPNDQHIVVEDREELLEDEHITDLENSSEPAPSVPWYLQVDAPESAFKPLSERQRLPELPLNPPPLLQPMLEYVSIDLGLEDLSIFDLRNIDPPPALGTNLLMVLGTARSEKHLHVSADRFCRWLRTTHRLSPYPDGLLGRGELKLKMRRKNRRARLLSSVGSSESNTADDGLRTGWVCVNVGTIEDGGRTEELVAEPEGFVGFGEQISGAKVVIQMLTAEKREELDLEELWGGMLVRQQKRDARRLKGEDEGISNQDSEKSDNFLLTHKDRKDEQDYLGSEVGRASSFPKVLKSDPLSRPSIRPANPSSPNSLHNRGFHSHLRSFATDNNSRENTEYEGLDPLSIESRTQVSQEIASSCPLNPSSSAYLPPREEQTRPSNDAAGLVSLQALLIHLESRPYEDAVSMLGSGTEDHGSTRFLESFYQTFPIFPNVSDWMCRLSLTFYALKLAHPDYHKSDLMRLFNEMQASVIDIPSRIFVTVFKMLLTRRGEVSFSKESRGLSIASVEYALKVLEDMDLRGYDITTEEICTELMVATLFKNRNRKPHTKPHIQYRFNSDAVQRLQKALRRHTDGPGIIFVNVESHIRVLNAYADSGEWGGFWKHWNGIARSMQRRPKDLYLLMFRRVAEAGHQAHTMKALREWVPRMKREEPIVELDTDLAEVIMDCVQVAEPDTANEAGEGRNESGEWVKLWRICELSSTLRR